ncbi:MAG: hypothetical protein PWR10_655 [Halanaerobiales bacterium]|nr:hypothetical protein [Halanaerobiales bacterium]
MLQKNLEIMEREHPEIVKEIKRAESDGYKIEMIEAQNGSRTAIMNVDGTFLLVHSKYNPEREAQRLVEQIDLDRVNSIVVFGFGLGYHLLGLFDVLKDKKIKVFVIENKPVLVKEALKLHDFSQVFNSTNFYFLIKNKIEDQELFDFIDDNINSFFEEIDFLILPSAIKYSGKFSLLFHEVMNELLNKIIGNKVTTIKDGKTWNLNFLKNLTLLINTPGYVRFKGFAQGQPAFLVAAGPSLQKNVNHLKKAKGKGLIIAIDASLKTLLSRDIIPDILTVLDGKKEIFKYLEGVNYERLKETILVACPRVQPKIFNDWPGPKIMAPTFMDVTEDYILSWLEQYMDYKGRMPTGGSVAHLAFVFAYYLQADPIVFVGQDLALTGNYTHAEGNVFRRTVEEDMKVSGKKYFKIKDINGDPVWTRGDFYNYLQWFNRSIRVMKNMGTEIKFIDATEGGARIEGTELMTLEKVVDKYCQKEIGAKDRLLTEILSFTPQWGEELLIELKKIIGGIAEVKELAEKGLRLIDRLIDAPSFEEEMVDNLSSQLGEINERINSLKNNIIFFESEIFDVYFKRDFYKGDMQVLNQTVDFYNRLITGSNRTLEIMKENYCILTKEEK